MRSFVILGGFLLAAGVAACGSSDDSNGAGSGGSAGTGGAAGAGGSAGMGGSAGENGSAGMGGSAGMSGSAGMGGSAGMSGAAGMGGSSGMGGSAEAPSLGACDNGGDATAIANAGDSLANIGASCGASQCLGQIGNPAAYASCVSACIQDGVAGLSAACANCYGNVGRCGLENTCFACATSYCGASCQSCLNGGMCLTTLDACTGIPSEPCP